MENEDSPSSISKRPRPIVSCLSCRSRKLACSRTLPCNKCIKGGRASSCEYAPGREPARNEKITGTNGAKRPRLDENATDLPTTVVTARFDELQARVQQLEQALTFQRANPQPVTPLLVDSPSESPVVNSGPIYHTQANAEEVNSQTFLDRSIVSQVCLDI